MTTEGLKGTVHYELRGDIALLTIDNPPVNPLSSGVRQGLMDGFDKALADDAVQGIVVTGAGRAFIAGADISEFGGESKGAGLHEVMLKMENSPKPVAAAVNGTAFGGGLEVALCCHFRIAGPKAMVGLPEVNLGLLPGAGGTQRLPRIIGAATALQFMLTGQGAPAAQALKLGIVDAVEEGDLVQASIDHLHQHIASGQAAPKIRDRNDRVQADRPQIDAICAEATKMIERARRGQFAPQQIIECVRTAVTTDDFDQGMKFEGQAFAKCLTNPQREAMIHVFFSERQVARIPDVPKETQTVPVKRAMVIGSGTMGGGIAMCFANAGIPVSVLDQDAQNLERGMGVIRKNYQSQVDRNRISQAQMDERVGLITPCLEMAQAAQDADLSIEAVYENLDLKKKIFGELDQHMKPGAILASNTSALDIDQIAQATSRPDAVVGMHFFSPANIMRLLEVVRGAQSSQQTIATAMAMGKILGKIAVLAGNCPGFIGNRMLGGYSRQAQMLILEGAMPSQVDKVVTGFGLNMGPFQMADLVGLDLGWRARKMAGGSNEITARITDAICEQGHYGQKNGKGYYEYAEGSRVGTPSADVEELIVKVSKELGIQRRDIGDEEILDRCMLPLVNIGAKILDEKMAIRASDIDIVYINGYGFPQWRGGPMFYGSSRGLDQVLARLQEFEAAHGDFWQPAKLIEQLVKEGKNAF